MGEVTSTSLHGSIAGPGLELSEGDMKGTHVLAQLLRGLAVEHGLHIPQDRRVQFPAFAARVTLDSGQRLLLHSKKGGGGCNTFVEMTTDGASMHAALTDE